MGQPMLFIVGQEHEHPRGFLSWLPIDADGMPDLKAR